MGRIDRLIDRIGATVTTYNKTVLLVMLLATAGVLAGIPMLEMGQDGAFGDEIDPESDVAQAGEYIEDNYGPMFGGDEDEPPTATSTVYVRDEGGDVLTRDGLLAAIDYQIAVTENETVAANLTDQGTLGPQNLVGTYLAEDPDASLREQRAAIADASDEEIATAIDATLDGGERTQAFMPASYDPGSTEAESFRMQFTFAVDEQPENNLASPPSAAQEVLFETAEAHEESELYTMGEFARQEWTDQQNSDTLWLILPPALALVVGVLAFAYRNPVDVAIGFVGVVLSVLWMFGILGWLGVPVGMTVIIGPVLIVALSIDFGLHVFMRYRERRLDHPEEELSTAMGRSTGAVAVAFLLVTLTAAIGFLSNLVNPLSFIRDLGVGITLGVVASFVLFTTFVPALKVSADRLLERVGFDTRQAPLGRGRLLRPVLESGVHAAQRAAPLVIVVALVAGAAGGAAYTELDRQGFQQEFEVADWKTELPGPMAWESAEMEYQERVDYQEAQYQSTDDFTSVTRFLINGDPTDPATLAAVDAGHEAAADSDAAFAQGGEVAVRSPLSVMERVAQQDESFAETYRAADTDDDGVPDRNLEQVYDALYATAPELAAQVLERTDEGEYRSMLVYVPVEQADDLGERGDEMHAMADEMEAAGEGATVTPVGFATLNNAELAVLADGILETMLLALAGILVALAAVYRFERGSATLGVVTVVPIALVLGMVFGAMYLLDVPLTFVTALLMSITIGLGIDYNIHVSDRFAQELENGASTIGALTAATTGTGGALLGSALTSGVAFLTLMLHPSPQLYSFGAIVVLALSLSFVLSVLVLPSLLYLWAEYLGDVDTPEPTAAVPGDD